MEEGIVLLTLRARTLERQKFGLIQRVVQRVTINDNE